MEAQKQPTAAQADQARDIMLKGIADLVNEKPQEVIALLKKFNRPIPNNPTNVQLGEAISKGFAVPDFMGALVVMANANSSSKEKYDNAKGGGKAAAPSGNMIGDIANAIGNVALASAQITASVKEVEKAKVENKSKLIEFITKKDENKTARQVASIQAQQAALVAAANKPKDNTTTYVVIGIFATVVLVGGLFAFSKRTNPQ